MRAGRGNFPVKVGHSSRMACSCSVVSARVEQERLYVCMYVCMYVCVCMSVCIYGHVCKYVYLCMYAYIFTYVWFGLVWFRGLTYVCIHVYICVYLYIYIYTYITYVTGYDASAKPRVEYNRHSDYWVVHAESSLNLSPVNSPLKLPTVTCAGVCHNIASPRPPVIT